MSDTRRDTLERSLRTARDRTMMGAGLLVLMLGVAAAMMALVWRGWWELAVAAIVPGAGLIGGGGLLVAVLVDARARRRTLRTLATLTGGPTAEAYLDLLGHERSRWALALDVELAPPLTAAARAQLADQVRRRVPDARCEWRAGGATVHVISATCDTNPSVYANRRRRSVHDNGPLHAFFLAVAGGVLGGPPARGHVARVAVRAIDPS